MSTSLLTTTKSACINDAELVDKKPFGKSGHAVFQCRYRNQEGFFKENKKGNPRLSELEVAFSAVWHFLLPKQTAPVRLVRNDEGDVLGVFVDKIDDLTPLAIDVEPSSLPIEELAAALVIAYFLSEDDLHRGNIATAKGHLVKIDHDMSFYDLVSREKSGQRLYHLDENRFKIARCDIENFPDISVANNHYWVTKTRNITGALAYSEELAKKFKQLKDDPHFKHEKFYWFLNVILVEPEQVRQSLSIHFTKDSEIASVVVRAFARRQAALKAVLLTMPEFAQAVSDNRDSYLKRLNNSTTLDKRTLEKKINDIVLSCKNNKEKGNTPLHAALGSACFRGDETISMFKEFLHKRNSHDESCLDVACKKGILTEVTSLTGAGLAVTEKAISIATEHGHKSVLYFLLGKKQIGLSFKQQLLLIAVKENHFDIAFTFLENNPKLQISVRHESEVALMLGFINKTLSESELLSFAKQAIDHEQFQTVQKALAMMTMSPVSKEAICDHLNAIKDTGLKRRWASFIGKKTQKKMSTVSRHVLGDILRKNNIRIPNDKKMSTIKRVEADAITLTVFSERTFEESPTVVKTEEMISHELSEALKKPENANLFYGYLQESKTLFEKPAQVEKNLILALSNAIEKISEDNTLDENTQKNAALHAFVIVVPHIKSLENLKELYTLLRSEKCRFIKKLRTEPWILRKIRGPYGITSSYKTIFHAIRAQVKSVRAELAATLSEEDQKSLKSLTQDGLGFFGLMTRSRKVALPTPQGPALS